VKQRNQQPPGITFVDGAGVQQPRTAAVSGYVFSVAAGFQPAVEPGILPGGLSRGPRSQFRVQTCHSGRQDAALYGSKDGCRYRRKATLNTYVSGGPAAVAALRRRRLTESDASGFSNVLRLVLRTQPRSIEIAPQAAAEGGSISATNL